ncbi:uncharacterized protein EDB93DRAFT_179358 [Suillus bovinus]|uniref:uncharacterized protein n=1 Tax=Suillus bovinus TaxID=48563 RepID=UPI001B86A53D|nr:uncharacterized protein EDB93DRAFT_179358 [Suillus bovinus]KAG2128051.1 hypothetical protein EDB93DRAFT_179358 [Suillus bovinus]
MDYSAEDIAAARILQYLAYICTALIAFWSYDYICSLHDEWTFLLRSRWTKVKCLYIIARYVPFFLIAADICLTLTPNEDPKTCKMFINIYSCFAVISLTCSECFFVLRTYALWSGNRIVLVAMLSTFFAIIVSFTAIWFRAVATSRYFSTSEISGIPGIVGCYRTSSNVKLYLPFILLFVFQLGLVSLTLIRAMRNWQSTRYSLYATLVKHNIFYYACGLRKSFVSMLIVIFPDSPYHSFLEDFEVFILSILATRMHLHLWHIDNNTHDVFVSIPMSPISPMSLV